MGEASVKDRGTLEKIYPRDVFEQDAARNARGDAEVLHGLRILSRPDDEGSFKVTRMSRQVGEMDPDADGAFLVPQTDRATGGLREESYGGMSETSHSNQSSIEEEYARFLEDVIETARTATFKRPIGQDERLKGFRGG